MKKIILLSFLMYTVFLNGSSAQQQPNTYSIRFSTLINKKILIDKGDKRLIIAKETLLKRADKILSKPNRSIVNSSKREINIDVNDFVSIAPYWWPNPKGKDLPYIPIDGKINPERNKFSDRVVLKEFCEDIETLGLAYFFSGDEKYAKKASEQLRYFFFNPDTRMNPNFNNSQLIKGRQMESSSIIEANPLLKCLDGIQLISDSPNWNTTDKNKMKGWVSDLLNWMLTDRISAKFSEAKNNIGTYYLIQTSTYSLFIERKDIAQRLIKENIPRLIDSQIEKDGSMPLELKRSKPWSYLSYNLYGFLNLIKIGDQIGMDLLNYQSPKGNSLKKAFEWLIPYAEKKGIYQKRYSIPQLEAKTILMRVPRIHIPYQISATYKPSTYYYYVLTDDEIAE